MRERLHYRDEINRAAVRIELPVLIFFPIEFRWALSRRGFWFPWIARGVMKLAWTRNGRGLRRLAELLLSTLCGIHPRTYLFDVQQSADHFSQVFTLEPLYLIRIQKSRCVCTALLVKKTAGGTAPGHG
jgi:hypothetical protein